MATLISPIFRAEMGAAQGTHAAEAPPWPPELDSAVLALSQVFALCAMVCVHSWPGLRRLL